MKGTFVAVILFSAFALVVGCEDDPTTPPSGNSAKLLPLTTREAVVNNIEVAWNQRKPGAIDDLLDENYTFYFAPGDVGGGIPPSWDRATDLAATTALLQSNTVPPTPPAPVCRQVAVDLDLDGLTWTETPVAASASTPAEIWYTTTVSYTFTFEMEPDQTYIAVPGSKAQFKVREVEGGWRLVEWRDLGGNTAATASEAGESPTWGKVKSVYDESLASSGAKTWGSIRTLYRN